MRLLKVTEEYRVDTEEAAKIEMEKLRAAASSEGYTLTKCGYTLKEKKSKGEVIDFGYLVTAVKVFGGFFE